MTKPGLFRFALATLVALLIGVGLSGAQKQTHVVIMHTNDIHGHVLPENGAGGLAMIAAMVKQAKPDLLLDAGDMFTGTLLSDTFHGEPVIALMNRMGYRASILGNHEFDYGLGMLRTRVDQAKFPILSANVVLPYKDVGQTAVIEVKGIRFGIIGLTTEEAPITTHPKFMKNVTVRELVTTLEETLPRLQARSDFIIVLGHLRADEELRIARAFPAINLIIGGHIGELPEPIREKNTMIVRTGRFGEHVGRVDLDFEDRRIVTMVGALFDVKGIPPDPEAVQIVRPFQSKIDAKMRVVLGEATAAMSRTAGQESPLLNLVADAFRDKMGTQIALTNPGGVRTDLPAGPITYGKIFEILPFENTLVNMKITGAQLKRSLAVDVTAVSGVRAVFDLKRPVHDRLVSATLEDGSPLIDDALYSVTINDFMQVGGDGYDEFANGKEVVDSGILLRNVVADYISSRKTVSPVLDGRVQILK